MTTAEQSRVWKARYKAEHGVAYGTEKYREVRKNLASPTVKDVRFSAAVYEAIRERAPGYFLQKPEKIVDWTATLSAALRAEFVYAGVLAALARARTADSTRPENVERTIEKRRVLGGKKSGAKEQKVKAFDRMVEALDAVEVNGKFLGDCTGADLLRAAVELEEQAREATAQSQFYRQLAAIVGKTTTVRSYNDRAGIVGLITSRYKEEA